MAYMLLIVEPVGERRARTEPELRERYEVRELGPCFE